MAVFLRERVHCLVDNLRLGEALLSCLLAGRLPPKDQSVKASWIVATVMARALERERRKAGLEGYEGLDLEWIYVPKLKMRYGQWVAPTVVERFETNCQNP